MGTVQYGAKEVEIGATLSHQHPIRFDTLQIEQDKVMI